MWRAFLVCIGLLVGGSAVAQDQPRPGNFGYPSGVGNIGSGTTGLTNGTYPLNFYNTNPPSGANDPEWTVQANVVGNTLRITNLNTSGFSAIAYSDALLYEHGALGIDNSGTSRPAAGTVTGSISGTTLTVTAVSAGSVGSNNTVTGAGVTAGTKVTGQLTNTGFIGTGSIGGLVLTITGVTQGSLAVGAVIAGTSVTTGTQIVALGTGAGGTGTYILSNLHGVIGSEAITQAGGPGTYTVSLSQTAPSETLTLAGEDVGVNGSRTFMECSNLSGEPSPPDCEILQTYGNPAVQHVMVRLDPSQNFYVDPNSGGNGTIIRTDHVHGRLAISGGVSGTTPLTSLDVYLPGGVGGCAVVGRGLTSRDDCNFGVHGVDAVIYSTDTANGPVLRLRSPNHRTDWYLDDTTGIVHFFDMTSATSTPIAYLTDGTGQVSAKTGVQEIIGKLKSADMNSTADQAFTMVSNLPAAYVLSSIIATNCGADPTGAAGGIYTAASKGGTAIVAAAQTYTALATSAAVQALTIQNASLTSAGRIAATQLQFSLTTAKGSAATCDLYVVGMGLP